VRLPLASRHQDERHVRFSFRAPYPGFLPAQPTFLLDLEFCDLKYVLRVIVTDRPWSDGVAQRPLLPGVEHR
jgi:hypothetical protein